MVLENDISFKAHLKLVNVVHNIRLLTGKLKCYYEQKVLPFFLQILVVCLLNT